MAAYLIRRIVQMVLVLFFAALTTYLLFSVAPGGPLTGLAESQRKITPQQIALIRAKYELDFYFPWRFSRWLTGLPNGPLVIGGQNLFANVPIGCYMERQSPPSCDQYLYLADIPKYHPDVKSSKGIIRGDFGLSNGITVGRPVWEVIASRLRPTLELSILSLFLSLLIGIPMGIYSAVHQYSRFDYIFTTLAFIGTSMPTFFFGLLMILLFSVMPVFWQDQAPWLLRLPPGSYISPRPYEIASWLPRIQGGSAIDHILHLIMPVTVLTVISIAGWSRFVRASMLEVLRQDYVRTARAKGLIESVVINKHALRNALIPFVTIVVFALPGIFGGAIITETIFAWPGMGRLFIDALGRNDWPVALALVFITAVLTVIATLLGDILYTVVDPRIRFS